MAITRGRSATRAAPIKDDRLSFVLLLWVEPRSCAASTAGMAKDGDHPAGVPEWRWHVRHVQNGEEAWFRRTADVLAYVAEQSGLSPPR